MGGRGGANAARTQKGSKDIRVREAEWAFSLVRSFKMGIPQTEGGKGRSYARVGSVALSATRTTSARLGKVSHLREGLRQLGETP